MTEREILKLEMKKCFEFFWQMTNHNPLSKGYGLMIDRTNKPDIASIASVGFALTSYMIGVKHQWISYEQGLERAIGTLRTLRDRVPNYKGFFVHFCNMETGERLKQCEFSTIDTALAVNGILTVDSFFDHQEIHRISNDIMERIDWNVLIYEEGGKSYFRMAYNDNPEGDYSNGVTGFLGGWTMCAEQLMMYIQAAAHSGMPKETVKRLYLDFQREYKEYKGYGCYHEPSGTLFVYQYSHAWFDFTKYLGCDGINWADNTKNATLAQIEWCKDHPEFPTFGEGLWGVSAFDSPRGYFVAGTEPAFRSPSTDGTIGPCAIAGSLPFTYEESAKALKYLYDKHPKLWGNYGFKDSYNAQNSWYASTYLGIDKGETLLMIANTLYGDVWESYMSHPRVKTAIEKLDMIEL